MPYLSPRKKIFAQFLEGEEGLSPRNPQDFGGGNSLLWHFESLEPKVAPLREGHSVGHRGWRGEPPLILHVPPRLLSAPRSLHFHEALARRRGHCAVVGCHRDLDAAQ